MFVCEINVCIVLCYVCPGVLTLARVLSSVCYQNYYTCMHSYYENNKIIYKEWNTRS